MSLKRVGGLGFVFGGGNDLDGCYSLHPLIKSPGFITSIPALMQRIKENNFPEPQRGWYNVHKDIVEIT